MYLEAIQRIRTMNKNEPELEQSNDCLKKSSNNMYTTNIY